MEAIGRRWSLVGWNGFFTVGLPGPTAPEFQAVGYCDRKEPDEPLRDGQSPFYHQQHFGLGVHGKVGVHGTLSGLDFPVRGISLRRSVHDAGFVCGRDRWGTLYFFGIVCGHFFCWA